MSEEKTVKYIEENIKTVKYTEEDIVQVLRLIDSLVVQGINNIQAVSAISQILMGKQIKEE